MVLWESVYKHHSGTGTKPFPSVKFPASEHTPTPSASLRAGGGRDGVRVSVWAPVPAQDSPCASLGSSSSSVN